MGKSMSTTKTDEVKTVQESTIDVETLKKENDSLKEMMEKQAKSFSEQLEAIKQMMASQQPTSVTVENTKTTPTYSDYDGIRPDKYIQVMSLTPNLLCLSAGNGKMFRFPQFGSVMNIMYGDLVEIVRNHFELATCGGFYIFDERAVNLAGLKEFYGKILSKDSIDVLLDMTSDEIRQLLQPISDFQKNAIADEVVKQIANGRDVGTSKIEIIKEVCNRDIMLAVNEMKNFEKEVAESETR
jgi:hypothetical protein